MWQSGGVLFLALKMSQDPVDGVLLLDESDDFDRPTAATENFNVDIEHALESLGPGHSSMALGRCPCCRICAGLKCLATSGRSDFSAPAGLGAFISPLGYRQPARINGAELDAPLTDRFAADIDASFSQ